MPQRDLKGHAQILVDCGKTRFSGGSTIVDVSEGVVEIIRKGVIPQEEIENAAR
jgi:tRNA A37 threonylcarbamoyladenosine synthetase subunit TsaC/SUA5/YrdC